VTVARPVVLAAALSLIVFLLACALGVGGLTKDEWHGDVPHYQTFGERMVDGEVPYHDFYSEYPPGALPAFLLPAAVAGNQYIGGFKWLMALLGCVALLAAAATLATLGADMTRLAVSLGSIAVAPALLGHVFLNRYDPWPMALVSVGLLLLLLRRAVAAAVCIALAVTAKIYAIAALPVVALYVWWNDGRRALTRSAAAFLVAGTLIVLPFAAVAFGGLGFSFYVQTTRPLQVESLGASVLLAADQLGLYDARLFGGKANSIDVHGTLAAGVGVFTSLLLVAAVGAVVLVYRRGTHGRESFVAAFAASIAAYVAFFKVISPQYLSWLIPLVPLVAGRRARVATGLFLLALLATQIEIYGFEPIHTLPGTSFLGGEPDAWAPWLLLGRNLLLVAVFGLLLSQLRELSFPRAAPAPAAQAAAPGLCSDRTAARSRSSSAAARRG
jgi:hypothetical protein